MVAALNHAFETKGMGGVQQAKQTQIWLPMRSAIFSPTPAFCLGVSANASKKRRPSLQTMPSTQGSLKRCLVASISQPKLLRIRIAGSCLLVLAGPGLCSLQHCSGPAGREAAQDGAEGQAITWLMALMCRSRSCGQVLSL